MAYGSDPLTYKVTYDKDITAGMQTTLLNRALSKLSTDFAEGKVELNPRTFGLTITNIPTSTVEDYIKKEAKKERFNARLDALDPNTARASYETQRSPVERSSPDKSRPASDISGKETKQTRQTQEKKPLAADRIRDPVNVPIKSPYTRKDHEKLPSDHEDYQPSKAEQEISNIADDKTDEMNFYLAILRSNICQDALERVITFPGIENLDLNKALSYQKKDIADYIFEILKENKEIKKIKSLLTLDLVKEAISNYEGQKGSGEFYLPKDQSGEWAELGAQKKEYEELKADEAKFRIHLSSQGRSNASIDAIIKNIRQFDYETICTKIAGYELRDELVELVAEKIEDWNKERSTFEDLKEYTEDPKDLLVINFKDSQIYIAAIPSKEGEEILSALKITGNKAYDLLSWNNTDANYSRFKELMQLFGINVRELVYCQPEYSKKSKAQDKPEKKRTSILETKTELTQDDVLKFMKNNPGITHRLSITEGLQESFPSIKVDQVKVAYHLSTLKKRELLKSGSPGHWLVK